MIPPVVADHDRLLSAARELDELLRDLKAVLARPVVEAHDLGATWEEVSVAFGVSRQAVHERFGPNGRALRRSGGPQPSWSPVTKTVACSWSPVTTRVDYQPNRTSGFRDN